MPSTQLSLESLQQKLASYCIYGELTWKTKGDFIQTLLQIHHKKRIETLKQEMAHFSESLLENEQWHHCTAERGVLAQAKVIGMTMTGVAINHLLIDNIKPSVVIIEEAGEVLETQVIAALSPSVQHLIMIGDHKQLRPTVCCHKLEKDYNFNVSLLERLILNGHYKVTLTHQSRMLREFVPLLSRVYGSLKTNPDAIKSNKPTACLAESMYFWNHEYPEKKVGTSFCNDSEAEMLVHTVLWCILQSRGTRVHPSQVTIIAMYRAQVDIIRRKLRFFCKQNELLVQHLLTEDVNNQEAANQTIRPFNSFIKVFSVDQYQGDENEFVFVSLVRSNKDRNMGHVKIINRMCVGCSRARSGLYFFGNSDFIEQNGGRHWQHVVNCFQKRKAVGRHFPVRCPRHPDSAIPISNWRDFQLDKIKGTSWQPTLCRHLCDQPMRCQLHSCKLKCHPHFGEEKCLVTVSKKLPCSHSISCPCWKPEVDLQCEAQCEKTLICGHHCDKGCGNQCSSECKRCQETERETLRHTLKVEQETIELKRKELADEIQFLEKSRNKGCLVAVPMAVSNTSASTRSKLNHIQAILSSYYEDWSEDGSTHKLELIVCQEVASPELRVRFLKSKNKILENISKAIPETLLMNTEIMTESRYLVHCPMTCSFTKRHIEDLPTIGLTKSRSDYGNGIFFMDPPDHNCLCTGISGLTPEIPQQSMALIICEVMLGRCLQSVCPDRQMGKSKLKEFESLQFSKTKLQRQMYGVYDAHQVLPSYLAICRRVSKKVRIICLTSKSCFSLSSFCF